MTEKRMMRFPDDPHPGAETFIVKGIDANGIVVQLFIVLAKDLEYAPLPEEEIQKKVEVK